MLEFYQGKNVLVTGHTGFKGSWLSRLLINAGANVTGYASEPPTQPNLFTITRLGESMRSVIGDIRDRGRLMAVFAEAKPDVVFHLAAQPIVRESYADPAYTYETNVMGTVNILECIRSSSHLCSFLNVTTDKVYENHEWAWGYRESDPLDGYDPYSNSKSCSELVTHSYRHSFFKECRTAISTARAGNVIGGGDFARDRIIPDAVRAAMNNETIVVRNPHSIRPYQHVLEPLQAYLMIAERQYGQKDLEGYYNVGPDDCDCVTTSTLVSLFCEAWGEGLGWISQKADGPHEASFLKLDCSKLKQRFGWKPVWHINDAVARTVEWTKAYVNHQDVAAIMDQQIAAFYSANNQH